MRKILIVLLTVLLSLGVLAACDPNSPNRPLGLPLDPTWAAEPWAQHADAVEAGWADPSFWPIGIWWAYWDSTADIEYDKAQGINFYSEGNSSQDACMLQQVGGMSWVDSDNIQNLSTCGEGIWPGVFLDDEVDGRYSDSAGDAYLQRLTDGERAAHPNKFVYTNYTQGVLQDSQPSNIPRGEQYINGYTDAVTVDQYWLTHDNACAAYWWFDVAPAEGGQCRSVQNYGRMVDALRLRDASDGKYQPTGIWIEDLSVSDSGTLAATPAQIKAAQWSTLIHGARMTLWFNNSFASSCPSGNLIRSAEDGLACVQPYVTAMRQVDTEIKFWAPWLNTQPYVWSFGPGLDTRLSVKGDVASIMAETSGGTGVRTFTLPPALAAAGQVIEGGRTIPVVDGTFTDTFETPTEYHLYMVQVPD